MDAFVRTVFLIVLIFLVVAGINMLVRFSKPAVRRVSPTFGAVLDFVA